MNPYSQNGYFYYFLILLAGGFLCFANLGSHSVYILDEAKNAEAAREMFVNGSWIVPTFNGDLRADKPPMHYWFMMISYKFFGINAFAARFFSAFFGVLTVISTYHFTKKFMGLKVAAIAAFVLCAAIFFMQEFHLAVPDPYLIFFVGFALFNFYDFYASGRSASLFPGVTKKSGWFFFYISLGLGILAKGPVAVALPGLIILIFLLMKKDFNWNSIKKINPFLGGILTLGISAPYFYLAHKATNGAFTEGFFLQHNLHRFSGEMEGHGGLPFVTWAFVLLGLLPYSFFIIQGFIQGWKQRKTNDFVLFSFLVSMVFVAFFSVSMTKLPNYPMPAYPFAAVLIAVYLNGVLTGSLAPKGYKISLWILTAVTVLMPVAGYIALAYAEPQLYGTRFSSFTLAILPCGTIAALVYLYKGKIKESIIVIGFSAMFLTFQLFQFVYPALVSQSPVSLAKDIVSTDSETILYKGYDPAFLFNFGRTFPFAENKTQVLKFLKENPGGTAVTKEKFYESDWKDVPTEIVLKQKALFENYTIVIFKLK